MDRTLAHPSAGVYPLCSVTVHSPVVAANPPCKGGSHPAGTGEETGYVARARARVRDSLCPDDLVNDYAHPPGSEPGVSLVHRVKLRQIPRWEGKATRNRSVCGYTV